MLSNPSAMVPPLMSMSSAIRWKTRRAVRRAAGAAGAQRLMDEGRSVIGRTRTATEQHLARACRGQLVDVADEDQHPARSGTARTRACMSGTMLPPQRCWSVERGSSATESVRHPGKVTAPVRRAAPEPGNQPWGPLVGSRWAIGEVRCPPCRGCADLLLLSGISGLSAQRAAVAAGPTHAKGLQDL